MPACLVVLSERGRIGCVQLDSAPAAPAGDPWYWIATAFAGVVLAAFLVEMAVFQTPGESVTRIGLTVWIAAYLGLLPSFLAQIRWLSRPPEQATLAFALAVFVPKCCDAGCLLCRSIIWAASTDTLLSPKKTWEGLLGGLLLRLVGPSASTGWGRYWNTTCRQGYSG